MDTKMANDSEITVFGLYDFPDELLLHVMGHLNDKNLLNMTQVCKRFKAIAQDAFAKKYNGDTGKDYYALKVHSANMTEQHKQYRPFFTRFGANMTALEITFIDESPDANSHWIMGLIQRYCKSLAKITVIGGSVNLSGIISRMPKPTLTHLRLEWVSTTNHSWSEYNHPKLIYLQVTTWSWAMTPFEVKNFIDNNRQLREIHLDGDFFAMDSILQICSGILNQLEYLRIYRKNDRVFALMTTPIYLERLKKLEIEFSDASGESWLRSIAMGCKNIEILHLDNSLTGSIIWNDKKIEHLCEFGQLKSLKLCAVNLSVNYIKQMVQKLPNLSSITLYNAGGDINNNLLEVIAICSKLTNLSIKLDPTSTTDYVISRIFNLDFNLLSQIAEATERNRGMKITLKSYHQELKIVSTQGEVRYGNSTVFHSGYDPINNQAKTLLDLGDECLEKIIGYLDMNAQAALYNTCTKTQRAIKYHLLNTVFYVHVYGMQYLSNTIDEHSFECLAPSIRQMIVERDLSIEQWEHLNLHCTRLNELCMAFPQNPIIYQTSLLWSNLRKLTLQCCSATDLRFFDCPLLTHLEVFFISSYYENWMHTLDFTDKFQHLTALKFNYYNDDVEQFLMALNESAVYQLQELSLKGSTFALEIEQERGVSTECCIKLINIISRYRNLTTLRLIIPAIMRTDMRFLFESCTKLAHFSVSCDENAYCSQAMLGSLKTNCKEIESVQMVFGDGRIYAYHRRVLGNILRLFPGVSITVAFLDSGLVFPLSVELIQNCLRF